MQMRGTCVMHRRWTEPSKSYRFFPGGLALCDRPLDTAAPAHPARVCARARRVSRWRSLGEAEGTLRHLRVRRWLASHALARTCVRTMAIQAVDLVAFTLTSDF